MISRCKDVNILSIPFIVSSIENYMLNRGAKGRERKDIRDLYAKYGTNEEIAVMLLEGLWKARKTGTLNLKPVRYTKRYDKGSGKWRDITVEDVVRQLYEQIAVDALKDATACVGKYQCTCLKNETKLLFDRDHKPVLDENGNQKTKLVGRGQIWAEDAVSNWMAEDRIRQIVKGDIYHNYGSIVHEDLFRYLEHRVRNWWVIFLIHLLMDEFGPVGLPIGSVLSITLDAIYLSQIYHHMLEGCYRIRKHRNGKTERVNLVEHELMWMDDIYLFCTSKKNAEAAKKELIRYTKTLDLVIKPSIRTIDKIDPPQHPNIHQAKQSYVDTVGYRVYPDHTTIRRKNYITAKRNLKRGAKHMTLKRAQSIMSQRGSIMHSDSYRFRKKYKTKKIWKLARKVIRDNAES